MYELILLREWLTWLKKRGVTLMLNNENLIIDEMPQYILSIYEITVTMYSIIESIN